MLITIKDITIAVLVKERIKKTTPRTTMVRGAYICVRKLLCLLR